MPSSEGSPVKLKGKAEVEGLRGYIDNMKKSLAMKENELQDWLDKHRGRNGVELDEESTKELEEKREYIAGIKSDIEDGKKRLENLRAEMLKDIKPA